MVDLPMDCLVTLASALRSMFKLIRNFTITGIMSMVFATLLLGYGYRVTAISDLVDHVEHENVVLAQTLMKSLWNDFGAQLGNTQKIANDELSRYLDLDALDHANHLQSKTYNIFQVKLYSFNDSVIYVTKSHPLETQDNISDNLAQAKLGDIISQRMVRNTAHSRSEIVLNHDLIMTYVPVYQPRSLHVIAVFEITANVTTTIGNIERRQSQIQWLLIIILVSVFASLFWVVKRADKQLQQNSIQIKDQQSQIEYQSHYDPLTALPNRQLFRDQLQQTIQSIQKRELLLAILIIDVNHFNQFSDTLGCLSGDKLLHQITERMTACIHGHDTIAYLGGERFAIILDGIHVVDEIEDIIKQLFDSTVIPFLINLNQLFITYNIGIVVYPFEKDEIESLIKKAIVAVNEAKTLGRNTYRFYKPKMGQRASSRFMLENALQHALNRKEFELHYQPIVHLQTGKVLSVEALLRWRSPKFGLVLPMEFIPILETTGLIVSVGQWVLEQACQQSIAWQQQGFGDLIVNVNVSSLQFSQNCIVDQVNHAIELSGLKPQLLDLEITESLLIDDINHTMKKLQILNEIGVSLSIDDFGTGYSSLAYLKHIPIDTLKIDKSFVQNIPNDTDDAAIIDAICALAYKLRLNVIAEGVEHIEQLQYLQQIGITRVQGYLFSRPLPATALEAVLRRDTLLDFQQSVA